MVPWAAVLVLGRKPTGQLHRREIRIGVVRPGRLVDAEEAVSDSAVDQRPQQVLVEVRDVGTASRMPSSAPSQTSASATTIAEAKAVGRQ
jgi:hypothetical protein